MGIADVESVGVVDELAGDGNVDGCLLLVACDDPDLYAPPQQFMTGLSDHTSTCPDPAKWAVGLFIILVTGQIGR